MRRCASRAGAAPVFAIQEDPMLELEPRPAWRTLRRPLLGLLGAGLTFLCLWVLAPFLASIAWATILAYVSWPAYRLVRKPFGRSATAAALSMIFLVTCLLVVPLLWLLTLVLLFFLYRDGDIIAHDLGRAAKRLFRGGYVRYVRAAGAITRAVFFGIILSAAAQGLIAGIGYRLAGLSAPVLLGALTAALSVIPLVGTALVWVPIATGLLIVGAWGKGLFLLAWGTLLVHPTDNLLRPLLVSNAAGLPFLLVALGAIGGLTAFGLVGVFAGPVLLGLAMQRWRQWTDGQPSGH